MLAAEGATWEAESQGNTRSKPTTDNSKFI